MKHYIIYKTTNKVNGKIYIGQHITTNLNDNYLGSGKIIQRAIKKYSEENFKREILFDFDNREEMNEKEAELVNEEFITRDDTYNLKPGGEGNWWYCNQKLTSEERSKNGFKGGKISGNILAQKVKDDPKFRKQIGNRFNSPTNIRFRGKQHTEDVKRRIGEANSKKQKGKGNSQYGKAWIYNIEEKRSIKVPKEEIQEWIDKGWNKGRKMKF